MMGLSPDRAGGAAASVADRQAAARQAFDRSAAAAARQAPAAGAGAGPQTLQEKLEEFLAGVPIGSPGGAESTSERGFDMAALLQFAEQAGLHDLPAEEIYRRFVEQKVSAAEQPDEQKREEPQKLKA